MKSKKRIKTIFLYILIFIFIYIISNAISIWKYSSKDEKTTADVAIVLGAATYGDEVSPVFRERINHGIWLYENGYVRKLILTGGYGEDNIYSDAYIAKLYAEEQGIPSEDILIEEKSIITQENIENAKNMMELNSYNTAIIVSDPLHMKRSMLMAKDVGMVAYSSPTPTTMYKSIGTKLSFLAREEFFYIGYKVYRLFI